MLTENREFDEIYGKYKNLVLKAAYTYSGNRDVAEDITQNTFLQLYIFYDDMNYYPIIREALERYPETDGIFASSDVIAAQAIQVCHEKGISVPEQMKIVGFDDVNVASLTIPGITTVRQPVREMAEAIIKTLDNASNGIMVPAKTVFPVSLVVRGSA